MIPTMNFAPALMEAIQQQDLDHLRDILSRIPDAERTATVNTPSRHGITPLQIAAAWSSSMNLQRRAPEKAIEIIRTLLTAGADPDQSQITGTLANISSRAMTDNPSVLATFDAIRDRKTLRQAMGLPTDTETAPAQRRRTM